MARTWSRPPWSLHSSTSPLHSTLSLSSTFPQAGHINAFSNILYFLYTTSDLHKQFGATSAAVFMETRPRHTSYVQSTTLVFYHNIHTTTCKRTHRNGDGYSDADGCAPPPQWNGRLASNYSRYTQQCWRLQWWWLRSASAVKCPPCVKERWSLPNTSLMNTSWTPSPCWLDKVGSPLAWFLLVSTTHTAIWVGVRSALSSFTLSYGSQYLRTTHNLSHTHPIGKFVPYVQHSYFLASLRSTWKCYPLVYWMFASSIA